MKNKDNVKLKVLDAVGSILKTDGFKFLKITKIAQVAGVDKRVIYSQFGSIDNLIEIYIFDHDYWTNTVRKVSDAIHAEMATFSHESLLNFYLEKQYKMLCEDVIQQQIVLWGITEKNDIINKITFEREKVVESLFKFLNDEHPDSLINYRAVYAIIVSGLYHLTLHSSMHKGKFCGIDLDDESGRSEIISALKLINSLIFKY